MRLGRWAVLALGIASAACASTIGPIVQSIQVLVVLDSLDDTLRVIPVDTPNVVHKVALGLNGIGSFGKHALALNGQTVAVGLHGMAYVYNLAPNISQICNVNLDSVIVSLAFADNGFVYAAIPTTNSAPNFQPSGFGPGCSEGVDLVRGGPRAFVNARSTLFVITGGAPSWLTTSAAQTTPLSPADSISLSGPGVAAGAVLGSDGFVYVINAGTGVQNARLSQVNPVSRTELSVIPGFGTLPQYIATDGADRIFVASAAEGLMVYNLRTNIVERSANGAIPLPAAPKGLAADDVGRVYTLISGACSGSGGDGSVQVFGADLVSQRPVTVGRCPVAIGVTNIPATLYHFTN